MTPASDPRAEAVARCAAPGGDREEAAAAVRRLLVADGHCPPEEADAAAADLVGLARHYGNRPFTPLEEVRRELGLDRGGFGRLLELFARLPELRSAVLAGPAGKYWSNTLLPLEERGVLDAALAGKPAFPHIVGLYPGPTCMFRCHFCVRVTGARYPHSALGNGNAALASVIDEMPTDNPHALYVSGGLEPLTNPGLGDLISRAAGRGFSMTLYTNSFALTEKALAGESGLWDLGAIRTSLYGLTDEEYEATTGKRNAFRRVDANLRRFQRMRAEREAPVRLGLNHIVLPGRAERLLDVVDFIAELNAVAPERPVDFLNLREDYSGRPDGALSVQERAELRRILLEFEEKVRRVTPTLAVDYGYALHALKSGADAQLVRIRPETMRPAAHPQAAVQVDVLGDVYLYREAGFPGLPGADRYIAGRVGPGSSLSGVVERFVNERVHVAPRPGDEYFMDGFDQVVAARLNQLEADVDAGWREGRGFLR
ncbi:dTDP-4-amino-4,6-dideoxy-D-glucose ammonia-lyase [Streptomyces sp. ME19-01-6]|uniref:dTDP-4-amino-4,6-dideoxy-D-glucose ammonia-lyase n=1 Tax=Streptomyces sp. ME19-01-6 TaxID=3028686 RepID=UPI0029B3C258|nr:dTDP-4-amino-4,6-dideoxy-D-glucose ammonia-lyase [Streptomyces sp. ME19-01-6]MDX3225468.1 dTDP-4-amino-4,6-dideoxy-D-glucose ammonia-lyase [Streptomyces sp. ME19-01-6]